MKAAAKHKHRLKGVIKRLLNKVGVEVRRTTTTLGPGSALRPLAVPHLFYEDVKARGFEPRFVLDIGANRGDWTRMMMEIFPHAEYLLVEPLEEMKDQLDALCRRHQNIDWVQVGAGSGEDRLLMSITDDLNGSSLLPAAEERLGSSGKQRYVPVASIDSILAARGSHIPDLVKLDIQGFELEALKGASALFGKTELFVLEVGLFQFRPGRPLLDEVVAFMEERGYLMYDVVDYMRRSYDGALGQLDVAFVQADGFFRSSARWH